MPKIFFSYAHEDEQLRDELEIHLSALKRQGVIETWHDRRITAGSDFSDSIDENLEAADVILLLVSPYFLASDYCYDVEMKRAIERHETGECVVVPVILHPCDWQRTPFGRLRATPKDGRPVSKHPNHHDAFLQIVGDINEIAQQRVSAEVTSLGTAPAGGSVPGAQSPSPRSSNLRTRRTFNDHERDQFRDATFDYVANFFENSLAELERRSPKCETAFRRIDRNSFSAAIYVSGEKRSACSIWIGGGPFGGDIAYSTNESGSSSSFNDSMSIADDGYSLGLEPLGLGIAKGRDREALTQQGAAEYFWAIFIHPLQ